MPGTLQVSHSTAAPSSQECGQLAANLGPLGAFGEGPCQEHPPAHPEKPSRLCSGLGPVPWPGLSWVSCPRGRGGDTAFRRRLRTGPRASPALPRPFAASFHLPLALRVCGDAATCCCLWAVGRETPGSPQPPRVRQVPAVTRRQHVLRLAGRQKKGAPFAPRSPRRLPEARTQMASRQSLWECQLTGEECAVRPETLRHQHGPVCCWRAGGSQEACQAPPPWPGSSAPAGLGDGSRAGTMGPMSGARHAGEGGQAPSGASSTPSWAPGGGGEGQEGLRKLPDDAPAGPQPRSPKLGRRARPSPSTPGAAPSTSASLLLRCCPGRGRTHVPRCGAN